MHAAQRREDFKLLKTAADSMLTRDKLNAALECVSSLAFLPPLAQHICCLSS